MTPQDAMRLLAVAASFDNRKPDKDAAVAWSVALGDLPWVDCRDAILEHYSQTSEWLMPAHVKAIVGRLRTKRLADAGDLLPPDFSHIGDEAEEEYATRAWLKAARKAVADGADPSSLPGRRGELKPRDMPKLLMPRPGDG